MQETVATPGRLYTVEEFLAEYAGHEGKVELVDSRVVEVSPERIRHGQLTLTVAMALKRALDAADTGLALVIDGPAVRPREGRVRVPDGLVFERAAHDPQDLVGDAPRVIVEIMSASSARIDAGAKAEEYLSLPSLSDYLIVDGDSRLVLHRIRQEDGSAITSVAEGGSLRLGAGLTVDVDRVWPDGG